MYLNETTSSYILIGTVRGNGFDCRTARVVLFEGQTDGMWNKVQAHMEWIVENMRELGEMICRA